MRFLVTGTITVEVEAPDAYAARCTLEDALPLGSELDRYDDCHGGEWTFRVDALPAEVV